MLFDTVAPLLPRPGPARRAPAPSADARRPARCRGCAPVVDGLNTADGLQRVGGNRKLYLKLLRQFVDDESDAAVRIRERLAAGDHATAERMAHTIKGVAGSLGARELQATAGDLERAVRENADPTEALCDRLASALSALDRRRSDHARRAGRGASRSRSRRLTRR